MKVYLAQKFEISGTPIQGPLPDNISTISDVIGIILSFLYPLAGILLFFMLVWGGYSFLMSGGQPEKIKSARGKMSTALIGFFLLIFSFLIVRFISSIFGLGGGII
ncbi:hypothetical protein A3H80_05200 [Candidatus Roizmanbacteria bacterium RIFCSPLOWO2_02_FULL_37_19]|uniref:Uncharacterized protein n=1 Tax=Candidatus Roizmanbacteria bacterium RIFCSPHIGHO2_02_FULL_37_24 TaxID=1802037 RepID=A0A1F7GYM5_9BACT|nr:MAG: hypothetical protein A2862_01070 [Candidatus Roizmanbacteria bacterium RIFCSPHIGHO2_01_FULL_38_41]OGK23622.1 MAG: hypothetical protein A3C24_05475 [Candidatus Roizmanbacteria bacterium RIFCSPHIGHO2_02_FULL_37_24]OGK32945.1 MAG: hypothetical protein A3E10_05520 [Candidatus Roizmanbacteria bacterium RIFCSPHIGHO2_12_FULL_37_23]OGK44002.1 MAG: hypothetical protein A2956_01140 [Candidatus Roizmanbacteria bacterium RIFCSPLOWO2_01_FULL_37_57]OGK54649.1 MAG: hypothetical protein A3H80_05200 [Ca